MRTPVKVLAWQLCIDVLTAPFAVVSVYCFLTFYEIFTQAELLVFTTTATYALPVMIFGLFFVIVLVISYMLLYGVSGAWQRYKK